MTATSDETQPAACPLRLVTDNEIAGKVLPVSVSWLQKDRKGAQLIPHIRLGDKVLYDLDAVAAAVRTLSIGGPRGRRGRAGAAK